MRPYLFFWLLCGCASATRLAYAPNCLEDFNRRFAQAASPPDQWELIDHLDGDDMRCLFESAAPLGASFFAHGPTIRYSGVNSLLIGRHFEKRVIELSDGEWYGFNASAIGKVLSSPGLFHVRFEQDAIFGYNDDFVHDFELKGVTAAFLIQSGLSTIQNNTHNLLFHDLIDTVKRVNPVVAVGKAERIGATAPTALSYFVLFRKPQGSAVP